MHIANDEEATPQGRDFHQAILVADPDPTLVVIGGKGRKTLNQATNGRLSDIIKLNLPPESTPQPSSVTD